MEIGFLVFGLINLIMAIVIYPLLRKEVTNPDCEQQVKDINTNKIAFAIYLGLSVACVLTGLIAWFVV